MKRCSKCKTVKTAAEFYPSKRTPDGLRYQCKKCHCATTIATRDADNARDANREYMARARAKDPEKFRARGRARARTKDAKSRARVALNNAVRAGRVLRPSRCSACGVICRPHGHHDDYNKPLGVRWLCSTCHGKEHRKC